jgi:hypothetical protein
MKEQLLKAIERLELLHAQAEVDGLDKVARIIQEAVDDLFWGYRELTKYE